MKIVEKRLALGLDLGTQSLSAVALDIDSAEKVFEHSLDYVKDPRLNVFGIRKKDYILPTKGEGEANQPLKMFFASLDAMFSDMKSAGISLDKIVVINSSGQQHGHIYLNHRSQSIFHRLDEPDSAQSNLITLLEGCQAYEAIPIWMTSDTIRQANFVRKYIGEKEALIKLSGSNAPPRFTGIVMRRVAEEFPEAYKQTENIQLLSSLIPAILTGNSKAPVDFGNACGMSLMDYGRKKWSSILVKTVSCGLPGGEAALKKKLPSIVAPYTIDGNIAEYFVAKYGFRSTCKIAAGSGDNPQSKVLVSGDLLSLGTSFVNMVATDGKTFDMNGLANAMYDGIGRPFIFSCRTNGAMVWDQLRAIYGMEKENYTQAEEALRQTTAAHYMVFWQPRSESFPPSGSFDLARVSHTEQVLNADYTGLIETTLAAVYVHSRSFSKGTIEPLYVTGGAAGSAEIMRRVAAIWNRNVISIEKCGASLGAAVVGAYALAKSERNEMDVGKFSANLLKRKAPVSPRPEDVTAYHSPGGYLERFTVEEQRILAAHTPN